MTDLDGFIQRQFQLVAAPLEGALQEPDVAGTRFIAARNGLFRETKTEWLYCLQPVATRDATCTPYGQLVPKIELRCGDVPWPIWGEFLEHARAALPNESAARFVWHPHSGSWRLAMRAAVVATPEKIDYLEPALQDGEIAVVDIHSHGRLSAFFSEEDDRDDAGCLRVSVVVGNVDTLPQVVARLVCPEGNYALNVDHEGRLKVGEG